MNYCCECPIDKRRKVQGFGTTAYGYFTNKLKEPEKKFYLCNAHMQAGKQLVANSLFHSGEAIEYEFKFFDLEDNLLELPKHTLCLLCPYK